jgi:hypothetical protein
LIRREPVTIPGFRIQAQDTPGYTTDTTDTTYATYAMRNTRSTKVAACGMPNASKPGRVELGESEGSDGSGPVSDSLATGPYPAMSGQSVASDVSSPPGSQYNLSLHIHRECASGRKVVDRLELVAVSDVEKLPSVFRKLLEKAFSGRLPGYMTSSAYYLFKPRDEFLHSKDDDYSSVQFRLVAEVDGWETVVCSRNLLEFSDDDVENQTQKMLIAMAQFDSSPVVLGGGAGELRVCVEGYSVSVDKAFLDRVSQELLQDHESFYKARYDSDFPALMTE